MEVSEVDGGSLGSTGSAESSKEGMLKCVPVISVDAAAFESIKPAESVAAEGIITKAIVWSAVQAEAVREQEIR
jgi:hypothetical protein